MSDDLVKINQRLIEILSPKRGYFGRVYTWGQRPTEYEYVGYELTEDFLPTLQGMSEDQRKNLAMIMSYFEIHAHPLKYLLDTNQKEQLYKLYSEIAWSHFMTVVMFGMLEIAVKGKRGVWLDKKFQKIKSFLENNLSKKLKESIAERYSVEEMFNYKKEIKNFSDVIDHLWYQIRSGFIHDAGIESKGLEWGTLSGIGTKDDPITTKHDVPMEEWLQIIWQAILNSYGYKGLLQHPKLS